MEAARHLNEKDMFDFDGSKETLLFKGLRLTAGRRQRNGLKSV